MRDSAKKIRSLAAERTPVADERALFPSVRTAFALLAARVSFIKPFTEPILVNPGWTFKPVAIRVRVPKSGNDIATPWILRGLRSGEEEAKDLSGSAHDG